MKPYFQLLAMAAVSSYLFGVGTRRAEANSRDVTVNYAVPCHQAKTFGAPPRVMGACTGSGIPCDSYCRPSIGGTSWNLIPLEADNWSTGTQYSASCQQKVYTSGNCTGGYMLSTYPTADPYICWWSNE